MILLGFLRSKLIYFKRFFYKSFAFLAFLEPRIFILELYSLFLHAISWKLFCRKSNNSVCFIGFVLIKKNSVFLVAFKKEFKYSFVSVKNEVLCSPAGRENGENSVKNYPRRSIERISKISLLISISPLVTIAGLIRLITRYF